MSGYLRRTIAVKQNINNNCIQKINIKNCIKNNLAIIVFLFVHGECSSPVACATHTWFYFFICFLTFFFQDAAGQQREQLMARNKELRRKIRELK